MEIIKHVPIIQEVIKEVEIIKYIEKPIEVIKEVVVTKEIPVIQTVEVPKPYQIIKHIPIVKTVEVEKHIIQKVPVAQISHYTKELQLPKIALPSLPTITGLSGGLSGLFSASGSSDYVEESHVVADEAAPHQYANTWEETPAYGSASTWQESPTY